MSKNFVLRTIVFTSLALIAFAANSVLCRLALGTNSIDATGFTSIRLLSGALVLLLILQVKKTTVKTETKGSWFAGIMLFTYAAAFSFAYVSLDTGIGALILFGSVQITMIVLSLISGNRLHTTEWIGVLIAFMGIVYLLSPGVVRPSFTGFTLMTFSGIAWGLYTIKGRDSKSPLLDTAYNFTRTIPFVFILFLASIQYLHLSIEGVLLAVLSGTIASGIGYILWYTALAGLSTVQAGVVQLIVPVFAAMGGVLFVSEQITLRLALSSILTLGGILLTILGRYYFSR